MSNQLTPVGQICQAIDKMEGSLNETLSGTGVSVSRFLATAKTAVQTHVDKDRLASADRNSLYLSIKKAASDGLMPDNREAALVIYRNRDKGIDEVQYQPMVQGLVKLARNSGEIESINSEVVYENDDFVLGYDTDGITFKHSPDWKGDRGNPVLVWATVKLKSGEIIARAYPKKRIEQIASRSKMSGNYDHLKGKDWEEFWRKAAIRNILKYAPKSTQLDKALEADGVEFQDDQEDVLPTETKVPVAKKTRASQAVNKSNDKSEDDNKVDDEIIDVEIVNDDELPI